MSITWIRGDEAALHSYARERTNQQGDQGMASHKDEGECRWPSGIPSLDDLEPAKVCGTVLPMSEQAQTQMRDSMEVIEYLLNRERVVWA
jgi:hypothetical protein